MCSSDLHLHRRSPRRPSGFHRRFVDVLDGLGEELADHADRMQTQGKHARQGAEHEKDLMNGFRRDACPAQPNASKRALQIPFAAVRAAA